MNTIAALFVAAVFVAGCGAPPAPERGYVATIAPVGMILQEIVGQRAEVHVLLKPGVSPHTYELQPVDARAAESGLALFYVDETLDGWAARLPAREKVALMEMVPEEMRRGYGEAVGIEENHGHGHEHEEIDGHFWSDPSVVKALVPGMVTKLAKLDPEGRADYEANGAAFVVELEALDQRIAEQVAQIRGQSVLLFHPSWNYYLERYGLKLAGLVEPSPGKERTPRALEGLLGALKAQGVKAVFSEPQLATGPARALAESAGLPLFELDPYGGVAGRKMYEEFMIFNTGVLVEALQ